MFCPFRNNIFAVSLHVLCRVACAGTESLHDFSTRSRFAKTMRRSPKQTSQKPEFRAWCAFASFRVVNAPGARCEGDVAIQKREV